jgi:hypothetical protein
MKNNNLMHFKEKTTLNRRKLYHFEFIIINQKNKIKIHELQALVLTRLRLSTVWHLQLQD